MPRPDSNTYVFCSLDGTHHPFTLDELGRFEYDDAYFVEALRHMEALGVAGFTFFIVYDASITLPRTGDDVVVIVYGDERRLVPPYLHDVAAVFTCFGMWPVLAGAPLVSRQGMLEAADLARRTAAWLPGAARHLVRAARRGRGAPVTAIPMGYQKLHHLPLKPFAERTNLLSFVGSINASSTRSLKQRLGTPKATSRAALADVLRRMQDRHPIAIEISAGYRESLARGPAHYSSVLMNTQICPAPRGTVPESARYFAAAKFGCIIVAERQPRTSVFADAPALTVRTWEELPDLVDDLVADPQRMAELHRRTLAWWDDVCAEPRVGELMAATLATRGERRERKARGRPAGREISGTLA